LWFEIQRRSPLDTNLTKWLSKCEGSLLEDKGKNSIYGDYDDDCGIERALNEENIKGDNQMKKRNKQEHN